MSKADKIKAAYGVDRHNSDVRGVFEAEVEFVGLFPEADTLIMVDISPAFASKKSCQLLPFPLKQRLRFDSTKLRESGFDKIVGLLDNTRYQNSLRRRLQQSGEQIPASIKYVLNLGPTADEDVRTEHLEALSLPPGIIRWYLMTKSHMGIPYLVAYGHDDACECWAHEEEDDEETPDMAVLRRQGLWDMELQPEYRNITDYCEVRHACNVVRLLRAIAGKELVLDSAAQVYTIAGLAKIFEINLAVGGFADSLRSRVVEWFLEPMSSKIIEILPEDCLKIALNLKISIVTRSAYRILVAERILQDADKRPLQQRRKETVFGRIMGDIDEDVLTSIEHAARGFSEHMQADVNALLSDRALETLGVHEYLLLLQRMRSAQTHWGPLFPTAPLIVAFNELKECLVAGLRRRIQAARIDAPENAYQDNIRDSLKIYVKQSSLQNYYPFAELNEEQEVLTASFWKVLGSYEGAIFDTAYFREFPQDIRRDVNKLAYQFNKAWKDLEALNSEAWFEGTSTSTSTSAEGPGGKPPTVGTGDFGFDLYKFRFQLSAQLHSYCRRKFENFLSHLYPDLELPMSRHLLLCLQDHHLRFLPLWAGGLDDGTGGVYQEAVPTAHLGPIGPGPAFRTGYTAASEADSVMADDLGYDVVSMATTEKRMRSTATQDGLSTVGNAHDILTPDDSMSEAFSFVDDDNDDNFGEARLRSRDTDMVLSAFRAGQQQRQQQQQQQGTTTATTTNNSSTSHDVPRTDTMIDLPIRQANRHEDFTLLDDGKSESELSSAIHGSVADSYTIGSDTLL